MYGPWQSIFNKTKTINQIMVVNMVQNWSHTYYSHYKVIKCIGFEPIHHVINLGVALSFKVFCKFDYVFLLKVLLV